MSLSPAEKLSQTEDPATAAVPPIPTRVRRGPRSVFQTWLKNASQPGGLLWRSVRSVAIGYVWLVYRTCRWEYIDHPEATTVLRQSSQPVICAFWHERLLMMPFNWPAFRRQCRQSMRILISSHRDGRLIAEICAAFGLETIHGSSSRGAVPALKQMIRALKEEDCLAITPDGPRGPRHQMAAGVTGVARISGAPVIPMAYATRFGFRLKSWDRFWVPLPFGRAVMVTGKPVVLGKDEPEKRAAMRIHASLMEVTRDAIRLVKQPPANPSQAPVRAMGLRLWLVRLYVGLTACLHPLVKLWLLRRVEKGKEEPSRLKERLGYASIPRPSGHVLWLHAASVGESLAVLPLIRALDEEYQDFQLLLTTGTRTSARLMQKRLPSSVIHQLAPVDTAPAIRRFLRHWRPDMLVLVESELWPVMLHSLARRHIPALVVNGRMSESSARLWGALGLVSPALFRAIRMVMAQSEEHANRFRRMAISQVRVMGNLKYDAEPLPLDESLFADFYAAVGNRRRWMLASSHPGEEKIAAQVHRQLSSKMNDLLTVIAPRHPERGEALANELQAMGLSVKRRALGELPDKDTAVFLADSLGEFGLFYRLCPVVCMGGSFVEHGGQNPLEPARLGSAVLGGPHMFNFSDIVQHLEQAGAWKSVRHGDDLAATLAHWLADDALVHQRGQAGEKALAAQAGALRQCMEWMAPMLNAAK